MRHHGFCLMLDSTTLPKDISSTRLQLPESSSREGCRYGCNIVSSAAEHSCQLSLIMGVTSASKATRTSKVERCK
eukprot:2407382-Pleurochrysis_carterae.AAC.1